MADSRGTREEGRGAVSSLWILVSVGALVMVVLLAVALGVVPGNRPGADPGPPLPTVPLPVLPSPSLSVRKGGAVPSTVPPERSSSPTGSPSATASATRGATPTPTGTRTPGGPERTPSAPAASGSTLTTGQVTGAYRLVDTYYDAFAGEVRVSNLSREPQRWTVRLEVPGGRLVASWVEGAAQAGVSGSRGRYTFTSGADLAAGASVSLRFHFDDTGRTTRPEVCTVNGSGCGGL